VSVTAFFFGCFGFFVFGAAFGLTGKSTNCRRVPNQLEQQTGRLVEIECTSILLFLVGAPSFSVAIVETRTEPSGGDADLNARAPIISLKLNATSDPSFFSMPNESTTESTGGVRVLHRRTGDDAASAGPGEGELGTTTTFALPFGSAFFLFAFGAALVATESVAVVVTVFLPAAGLRVRFGFSVSPFSSPPGSAKCFGLIVPLTVLLVVFAFKAGPRTFLVTDAVEFCFVFDFAEGFPGSGSSSWLSGISYTTVSLADFFVPQNCRITVPGDGNGDDEKACGGGEENAC